MLIAKRSQGSQRTESLEDENASTHGIGTAAPRAVVEKVDEISLVSAIVWLRHADCVRLPFKLSLAIFLFVAIVIVCASLRCSLSHSPSNPFECPSDDRLQAVVCGPAIR